MSDTKRREFITLLGGAAVTWPLAARAQQPAMPMIDFLAISSRGTYGYLVNAFRQGLSESGYVEGRNVGLCWFWLAQYDPTPVVPKNWKTWTISFPLPADVAGYRR